MLASDPELELEQQPLQTIAPPQGQLPTVQATPRAPLPTYQPDPYRQQRIGQLHSEISQLENRPSPHGFFGKAGKVLQTIGNVAGNTILGPANMSLIPGTEANRSQKYGAEQKELGELEKEEQGAQKEFAAGQEQKAQTENLRSETAARDNPASKEGAFQHVVLPDGSVVAISRDPSGKIVADEVFKGEGKPETEKVPPHITAMGPDGKPHIMERSASGAYDVDRGIAPQTYAGVVPQVLASKTIQLTNPDTGLPETFQYDPKTQSYSKAAGTPGTGSYAHQIQSATAAERMVNNSILPLVDKMEKAGELGIVTGRFSDFLNRDIGNAPPDVAQLHQLMNGVVSMMMGMYGFRRQQAVDQLSSQMGARMTPESMRAALHGIVQHAQSIQGGATNPEAGGAGPVGANVPPPGAKIIKFADVK